MHRAIVSLKEELEAVDWYQQRAEACSDDELRGVLVHNKNEEIEHAMMNLEWIRRHSEVFDANIKTYLNAKGPSSRSRSSRRRARAAAARRRQLRPSRSSLGIGSLKGASDGSPQAQARAAHRRGVGAGRRRGAARPQAPPRRGARWSTSPGRTGGSSARSTPAASSPSARDRSPACRTRVRAVQPLVEVRAPFTMKIAELDDAARGADDLDLDPVIAVAERVARAEDTRHLPRLQGRADHRHRRGEPPQAHRRERHPRVAAGRRRGARSPCAPRA